MTETPAHRTAVVTGGARGIGAATARRLSRDGLAVAVLDLDPTACATMADEIVASGGEAVGVAADVSSEASVTAAVEQVAAELGAPTVLINNAGITRDNLLFKMSVDEWDAVMSVHLRGAFLMCRAAQKYMVEAQWGRVVNLSSISALGNRGQVNYSAAKAGLQGFTKTVALELGRYGVTANAIAPGFVESDMTHATAERMGVSWDDFVAGATTQIAVRRIGQPEDIAGTISFLVSDDASYISGQVIYVAGGPTD